MITLMQAVYVTAICASVFGVSWLIVFKLPQLIDYIKYLRGPFRIGDKLILNGVHYYNGREVEVVGFESGEYLVDIIGYSFNPYACSASRLERTPPPAKGYEELFK